MNKFEKLIEYIINDEDDKARELFHTIVVEKSRDIYESIMDEESMEETVAGAEVEGMVDEIGHDETHAMEDEEDFGGDEGSEVAGDEFGGDDEVGGDEFGGEEAGEEEQLLNIDAKLDELLAKFDEIMGDEVGAGDDEFGGDDMAAGDEFGGDEFGGEETGEEFGAEVPMAEEEACDEEQVEEGKNPFAQSGKSGKSGSAKSGVSGKSGSGSAKSGKSGKPFESKSAPELMREYVDTIGNIYGGQGDASEGDAVGATGKKTSVNTKSGSVGPGANFGGNVVKTSSKSENQDGQTPTKASNEYNKGQGEINSGNRNVPGGKAGSPESTGKKYETASDAEGQTTDGKLSVATKSVQKQNTGVKR